MRTRQAYKLNLVSPLALSYLLLSLSPSPPSHRRCIFINFVVFPWIQLIFLQKLRPIHLLITHIRRVSICNHFTFCLNFILILADTTLLLYTKNKLRNLYFKQVKKYKMLYTLFKKINTSTL